MNLEELESSTPDYEKLTFYFLLVSFNFICLNISIFLQKFPIALCVTKNRRSKYFKTPCNALENEWGANIGEFNIKSNNYIQKNRLLNIFKSRAYKIIMDLETENEYYSLEDFERK